MGHCGPTHWPPKHEAPAWHALPQAPQFALSFSRSTQPPSHGFQLVAASAQLPPSQTPEPAQPENAASRSRAARFVMAFGHASARK